MLFSRNLASKGYNDKGVEGGKCSSLTLRLESEHFEAFKKAEEALFSRYPKEVVKAAGNTKLELWDGK